MIVKLRNNDGLAFFNQSISDFFEADTLLDNDVRTRDIVPAVNIYEDDDEYTIEVAIPGMDKEDFNISVEDGVLTISADVETEDEGEENEGDYTYQEYRYNSFSRSFPLPGDASEEGIEAGYEDGELIITIPKTVEWVETGREIEIG